MTNILRKVARQVSHFTPTNSTQYLALAIARKLGDMAAFRHYLVLFEHYPEDLLVKVFRRCLASKTPNGELFMFSLRQLTDQSNEF